MNTTGTADHDAAATAEEATAPPVIIFEPPPSARLRPRRTNGTDLLEAGGAVVASFCLTWLVYEQLTPASGGLGFAICWFAAFLAVYWLTALRGHGRHVARDRLMGALVGGAALLLVGSLALIVGVTVVHGLGSFRWHFFTTDMRLAGPLDPPTVGGGAAALIGTAEQVSLAVIMSVPAGIAVAVLLSEIGGRFARVVKVLVEAMNGVPSVLAGLFVLAIWILQFGFPESGFAVALALSISMLPTVARTAEVVLDLVPGGLREASLALGGSEWRTVLRVVLPTARAGLITATILGVARVVGETAPVLIDNAPSTAINWNPFRGPQDSLPYFVFRFIRASTLSYHPRAWTGAMVLIAVVLALFALARLSSRTPGTRRAARKGA